jgi:hypothetical protein
MVELGLNMAAPLFLLDRLRRQSAWMDKCHGELSILLWAICLLARSVLANDIQGRQRQPFHALSFPRT